MRLGRAAVREIEHRRRDEAGGGRTRQADEVALVGVRLDVEAREAQRRRRQVHEADGPAHAAERKQSPLEREHRGRHAERDQIGERIELHAEIARRAGHARDAAVEHVEHHGDADERRRRRELAAHRVDDAGPAAEQVGEREQAGQQRHAAPDAAAIVPACHGVQFELLLSLVLHASSTVLRRQRCERRFTAHDLVARLHMYRRRARNEQVDPRPELHHAKPLPRRRLVRLPSAGRRSAARGSRRFAGTTTGPPGRSNQTSVHSFSSPASFL